MSFSAYDTQMKCRFQPGDIVRFKENLDDYTLYSSSDGIAYELMPAPAPVYGGMTVRIAEAANSRYEIENLHGVPMYGKFVDGMFEREPVNRRSVSSDESISKFAREFNAHGKSIEELEQLVDYACLEFKRSFNYDKITKIAKLTRAAKRCVDRGDSPDELFKQIEKEAHRCFDTRKRGADQVLKNAEKRCEAIGVICLGIVTIVLVLGGLMELAASLLCGIVSALLCRYIMIKTKV